MVENKFYLVSEEVARRSAVIEARYRIADRRFVYDSKDILGLNLTDADKEKVEEVSKQQAMILVRENGNQIGTNKEEND